MGSLRHIVLFLLTISFIPAYAESKLPNDKDGWHRLGDQLAECSAVYNVAATLKESPAQGTSSYRELANNALIAGMYSTEHAGLSDSYLESVYTSKFNSWNGTIKDKKQAGKVFTKADQCLSETLTLQNQLVGTLREQSAHK